MSTRSKNPKSSLNTTKKVRFGKDAIKRSYERESSPILSLKAPRTVETKTYDGKRSKTKKETGSKEFLGLGKQEVGNTSQLAPSQLGNTSQLAPSQVDSTSQVATSQVAPQEKTAANKPLEQTNTPETNTPEIMTTTSPEDNIKNNTDITKIKVPNTLIIYIKTRVPNHLKIKYEPYMTVPTSRSHVVYFDPLVKYRWRAIKDIPYGVPKDNLFTQFFEPNQFDTMINRTLSNLFYAQKPINLLEAKDKGIITNNINLTLQTLFKTNNLFYINKKPFTIVGAKYNKSDWSLDKKPIEELFGIPGINSTTIQQEADEELADIPESIRSGNLASINLAKNMNASNLASGLNNINGNITPELLSPKRAHKKRKLYSLNSRLESLFESLKENKVVNDDEQNIDLGKDPLTFTILLSPSMIAEYIQTNPESDFVKYYQEYTFSKSTLIASYNKFSNLELEIAQDATYYKDKRLLNRDVLDKIKKDAKGPILLNEVVNFLQKSSNKTSTSSNVKTKFDRYSEYKQTFDNILYDIVTYTSDYISKIVELASILNDIYKAQQDYFEKQKKLLVFIKKNYATFFPNMMGLDLVFRCINLDIYICSSIIKNNPSNKYSDSFFENFNNFTMFYQNLIDYQKKVFYHKENGKLSISNSFYIGQMQKYINNPRLILMQVEIYYIFYYRVMLFSYFNNYDIWQMYYYTIENATNILFLETTNLLEGTQVLLTDYNNQYGSESTKQMFQKNKIVGISYEKPPSPGISGGAVMIGGADPNLNVDQGNILGQNNDVIVNPDNANLLYTAGASSSSPTSSTTTAGPAPKPSSTSGDNPDDEPDPINLPTSQLILVDNYGNNVLYFLRKKKPNEKTTILIDQMQKYIRLLENYIELYNLIILYTYFLEVSCVRQRRLYAADVNRSEVNSKMSKSKEDLLRQIRETINSIPSSIQIEDIEFPDISLADIRITGRPVNMDEADLDRLLDIVKRGINDNKNYQKYTDGRIQNMKNAIKKLKAKCEGVEDLFPITEDTNFLTQCGKILDEVKIDIPEYTVRSTYWIKKEISNYNETLSLNVNSQMLLLQKQAVNDRIMKTKDTTSSDWVISNVKGDGDCFFVTLADTLNAQLDMLNATTNNPYTVPQTSVLLPGQPPINRYTVESLRRLVADNFTQENYIRLLTLMDIRQVDEQRDNPITLDVSGIPNIDLEDIYINDDPSTNYYQWLVLNYDPDTYMPNGFKTLDEVRQTIQAKCRDDDGNLRRCFWADQTAIYIIENVLKIKIIPITLKDININTFYVGDRIRLEDNGMKIYKNNDDKLPKVEQIIVGIDELTSPVEITYYLIDDTGTQGTLTVKKRKNIFNYIDHESVITIDFLNTYAQDPPIDFDDYIFMFYDKDNHYDIVMNLGTKKYVYKFDEIPEYILYSIYNKYYRFNSSLEARDNNSFSKIPKFLDKFLKFQEEYTKYETENADKDIHRIPLVYGGKNASEKYSEFKPYSYYTPGADRVYGLPPSGYPGMGYPGMNYPGMGYPGMGPPYSRKYASPYRSLPYSKSPYSDNSGYKYSIKEMKSKLSFYIEIELEVYPGKSANIFQKSVIRCQSTYERIREAYAEIFGLTYAPLEMRENAAYIYSSNKGTKKTSKNIKTNNSDNQKTMKRR